MSKATSPRATQQLKNTNRDEQDCEMSFIAKGERESKFLRLKNPGRHRPGFHRHAKQPTPHTDESLNNERGSPTHKVAACFARCDICLV